MTELLELGAAEAAGRARQGEIDSGELFAAYRDRAAADDLDAYLWVAEEPAENSPGTPLAGVPLAVKDLFCVEGVPSTSGSRILEGYRPPYTATVVERLRAAGELEETATLGVYSHVHHDVKLRAEAAGFDLVVPRSRMAREGAELVGRLSSSD